jgi:hypothetical protein
MTAYVASVERESVVNRAIAASNVITWLLKTRHFDLNDLVLAYTSAGERGDS